MHIENSSLWKPQVFSFQFWLIFATLRSYSPPYCDAEVITWVWDRVTRAAMGESRKYYLSSRPAWEHAGSPGQYAKKTEKKNAKQLLTLLTFPCVPKMFLGSASSATPFKSRYFFLQNAIGKYYQYRKMNDLLPITITIEKQNKNRIGHFFSTAKRSDFYGGIPFFHVFYYRCWP